MGRIIGIVPQARLFEDEYPHHDQFICANPYVRRIEAQGATPIGLLCADGLAHDGALALCDGFLLTGGKKIWPYHLQIVDHAVRRRKPLLGICLGMQAIVAYFQVLEAGGGEDIPAAFEAMKRARHMFTLPVDGHQREDVTREDTRRACHPIEITQGTRLHEAVGRAGADAVSLHSYRVASVPDALIVSATAHDGMVEGVEYGGYIVGVQFHPEVEDAWTPLFTALVGGGWACSL